MPYLIGHDVGTSGTKTVLIDETARVLATHVTTYALEHAQHGYAEQDPERFYTACAEGARAVLAASGVAPADVAAMAFAGQMLALASLDATGRATRPLISWMDARAEAQAKRFIRRFGGARVLHVLAGASPTAKDLVCKIAWIADEEKEVFARTVAFTDATGFLVARTTGELVIDHTAAGATGMLDVKKRTWLTWLARLGGFPLHKMPRLVASTDVVGTLLPEAAKDFGLCTTTPVVMGLADITAAAVGSGALEHGDAHVYLGTSAWIGLTLASPLSVPKVGIASVPSADLHHALAIGESETAGACRAWLERMLGEGRDIEALAASAPPGARGLLFVPWMYGERTPFPNPHVRGAFLNLSLEHGPEDMVRALYEGVGYNLRWTLDAFDDAGHACRKLRAIGGGAQSDTWMQTLADITRTTVERVAAPQLSGAIGAALIAGVGVGAIRDVLAIKSLVPVERRFDPNASVRSIHETRYRTYRDFAPTLAHLVSRTGAHV